MCQDVTLTVHCDGLSLLPVCVLCAHRYHVLTASDPSADQLSVTFASNRVVLAYNGSFSALQPAEVKERDKTLYASYILTALRRQPTADADAGSRLYGHEWKDETRSSSPRATLTIARTFDQYTVNIAIIRLTPAATTSPSSRASSSPPTYSRSLFPLLHSVRRGITELQERDRRVRDRTKKQQEQLELIELMLDDKNTEAEAVEEEWLGACMRLVNAEKAKIRTMRAKTERVKEETAALTAKAVLAAKSALSDSESESEEEKEESKRAETGEVMEMRDDAVSGAAMDDGPALSFESGAMELSLPPDSSSPPASLTSLPSLQPDSNANSQRSSSTSSSLHVIQQPVQTERRSAGKRHCTAVRAQESSITT